MGSVKQGRNVRGPERCTMPNIVKRATTGAAALIAPDAVVLEIARLLSAGDFNPEDAVEETLVSGHALRGDDGRAGLNSDVYRVREAVVKHAKRPDTVPAGHVVRTSKRLEDDAATTGRVTVAFYWGEPPRRTARPTVAPGTESNPTAGS